jgi:hypothetical protein
VLAGIVASACLTIFLGQPPLPSSEIVGAILVVAAIAVLAAPGVIEARRKARAALG